MGRPSWALVTTRDVDRAVASLASRQHSLFSRAQALSVGSSSALVQRRRRAGAWIDEAPGVYGLPGAVHTWTRRVMVACLDLGPRSVASHRSAAVLHDFPHARPGPPEVTVPPRSGRSPRWRVHESVVGVADRVRVKGVPATSVTRTVLDQAGVLGPSDLASLVDSLLVDGRLRLSELTARALERRQPGRRGSAVLAEILEERGPGYVPPASELEALLLGALRTAGLPDPVRQHPLPSLGVRGRVDAAYPKSRLIIEADGRRWHTRVEDFERDRRRDIEAGMLGWRVVRFAWGDLVRSPAWVCEVVAAHLRAA